MPMLLFRMMTQFINYCEVEVLEVAEPDPDSPNDWKAFAESVRLDMATVLQVRTTEHTYEDVFLASEANKHHVVVNFSSVDTNAVMDFYKMDAAQLNKLLVNFKEYDTRGTGRITREQFKQVVQRHSAGNHAEKWLDNLFDILDSDQDGDIEFFEFVRSAALVSSKCNASNKARLAFTAFDIEGRGRVNREVFADALDAGFSLRASDGAHSSLGALVRNSNTTEDGLTFEEFNELVAQNPGLLDASVAALRQRMGLSPESDEE